MRRFIIILCLVICLIALWLMQTAFQPKEPVSASKVATVSLSAPTPTKAEEPPAARKPLKIASKGKIRLKPGESAVLGYWEIAPGIFDFENYSAIASERLRGLQSALQSTRGVDMLSAPTLVSQPGQRAMISIGNSNESTLSLSLQADPFAEDGGYDLSLELQRQEP